MANDVTDDLNLIFARLEEVTGVNPWAMENAASPRFRPAPPNADIPPA